MLFFISPKRKRNTTTATNGGDVNKTLQMHLNIYICVCMCVSLCVISVICEYSKETSLKHRNSIQLQTTISCNTPIESTLARTHSHISPATYTESAMTQHCKRLDTRNHTWMPHRSQTWKPQRHVEAICRSHKKPRMNAK